MKSIYAIGDVIGRCWPMASEEGIAAVESIAGLRKRSVSPGYHAYSHHTEIASWV